MSRVLQIALIPVLLILLIGLISISRPSNLTLPPTLEADILREVEANPQLTGVEVALVPKQERGFQAELRIQFTVFDHLSAQEAEELVFSALSFLQGVEKDPFFFRVALYIEIRTGEGLLLSQAYTDPEREGLLVWQNQESGYHRYSLYITHWEWVTHLWGKDVEQSSGYSVVSTSWGNFARPVSLATSYLCWVPLPNQDPNWANTQRVESYESTVTQDYSRFAPVERELPPQLEAQLRDGAKEVSWFHEIQVTLTKETKIPGSDWNWEGVIDIQVRVEVGTAASEAEDAVFSLLSILPEMISEDLLSGVGVHIQILDSKDILLSRGTSDPEQKLLVWHNQETKYKRFSFYLTDWDWVTHFYQNRGYVLTTTGYVRMVGWFPFSDQDPQWTFVGPVLDSEKDQPTYIRVPPLSAQEE